MRKILLPLFLIFSLFNFKCQNRQQNENIILGCMDSIACNYHEDATTDDSSCIYPEDCDECSGEKDGTGTIIDGDENNNGICDENEKMDGNNFISFNDCAIITKMSQSEINDYIKRFNTNLNTQITQDMCEIIRDYIMEIRLIRSNYQSN